jgi:hypothetical protein
MNNQQDNYEINQLDKSESKFMKKEKKEFEFKPLKFKTAMFVVGGLHIAAIGGIMVFSSMKAQAREIAKEDAKLLEAPIMVGVDYDKPVAEVAKATPTPAPVATPSPSPKPKVITKIPENPNPDYPNPKYTTEYVVKQGDTFHKIVKRYGLNAEKLKKINNIKDENKLMLGQKLKFM